MSWATRENNNDIVQCSERLKDVHFRCAFLTEKCKFFRPFGTTSMLVN